jgi:hypothetical protein
MLEHFQAQQQHDEILLQTTLLSILNTDQILCQSLKEVFRSFEFTIILGRTCSTPWLRLFIHYWPIMFSCFFGWKISMKHIVDLFQARLFCLPLKPKLQFSYLISCLTQQVFQATFLGNIEESSMGVVCATPKYLYK